MVIGHISNMYCLFEVWCLGIYLGAVFILGMPLIRGNMVLHFEGTSGNLKTSFWKQASLEWSHPGLVSHVKLWLKLDCNWNKKQTFHSTYFWVQSKHLSLFYGTDWYMITRDKYIKHLKKKMKSERQDELLMIWG